MEARPAVGRGGALVEYPRIAVGGGLLGALEEGLLEAGAPGDLFSSFEEIVAEFASMLPDGVRQQANLRLDTATSDPYDLTYEPIIGLAETTDFVSEGIELDLVANITPQWRALLNIGQQEAERANTALPLRQAVAEVVSKMQGSQLASLTIGGDLSPIDNFDALVVNPLSALAARDGTKSLELREWRANLVSTYEFREGRFDGFSVGGALRWQSKNAIGYPNRINDEGEVVSDVTRPFYGPDQTNADVWIGYKRALSDGIDWSVQLNVRNAFGDDDYIPVYMNPDGNLAVVRNPNPTETFLTTTFKF